MEWLQEIFKLGIFLRRIGRKFGCRLNLTFDSVPQNGWNQNATTCLCNVFLKSQIRSKIEHNGDKCGRNDCWNHNDSIVKRRGLNQRPKMGHENMKHNSWVDRMPCKIVIHRLFRFCPYQLQLVQILGQFFAALAGRATNWEAREELAVMGESRSGEKMEDQSSLGKDLSCKHIKSMRVLPRERKVLEKEKAMRALLRRAKPIGVNWNSSG